MKSFTLLIIGVTLSLAQQTEGLKVWGSLQNDLVGIHTFGGNVQDQLTYAGKSTFTLNFKNNNSSLVKIEGSGDLNILYGLYSDLLHDQVTSHPLTSTSETSLFFDLRKLYAAFFTSKADLFIGRQIINYGQGLVFSPIDVFSSINMYDLSFKRLGSDVIRLRVPIGVLSGIEMTTGLAGVSHKPVGAAKGYGSVKSVDLSTIIIYNSEDDVLLGGLTFKGDLIVGVYGELVGHVNNTENHQKVSAMLGLDYSLSNIWFFNVEYLFTENVNLSANVQATGQHSLFLSGRFSINELSSLNLSAITDLEHGTGFLTTHYTYNILQNADLTLFIRYLYTNRPATTDVSPDMEYGLSVKALF